jgi:hypothetical protein
MCPLKSINIMVRRPETRDHLFHIPQQVDVVREPTTQCAIDVACDTGETLRYRRYIAITTDFFADDLEVVVVVVIGDFYRPYTAGGIESIGWVSSSDWWRGTCEASAR